MPDITEKIFIEIIESFPTKISKNEFGNMLLRVCIDAINKNTSKLILSLGNQPVKDKVSRLSKLIEIFEFEMKLWKPNKS
jgi:hypothetical protein